MAVAIFKQSKCAEKVFQALTHTLRHLQVFNPFVFFPNLLKTKMMK